MKALVLSAGYGERLRPLTATTPKPLLEVGGHPLIHYPLLLLKEAGVREVAINTHHLAPQIETALGTGATLGLRITYSPEPVLAGTGGPLIALREYFDGEPFILLNCDTILDLKLELLLEFHRAHRGLATFVVRPSSNPDAYSRIECDAVGRIRRMRLLRPRARGVFDDYPSTLDEADATTLTPYMYCGVMVCEPAVLADLPAAPPFNLMTELFAPIVARGEPIFGYVHHGYFRTVDDHESFDNLRAEFAESPPQLSFLPH